MRHNIALRNRIMVSYTVYEYLFNWPSGSYLNIQHLILPVPR